MDYAENRIFLHAYVVGESCMAACQTGSADVAVLESVNADRSD